MLIYRAGGIHKAKDKRYTKSHNMMMNCEYLVGYCNYGVEDGLNKYFAEKDKEAQKQLGAKARGLAVWADAKFITAEVKKQLPSSTHKVGRSCCDASEVCLICLHIYLLQEHHSAITYCFTARHTVSLTQLSRDTRTCGSYYACLH